MLWIEERKDAGSSDEGRDGELQALFALPRTQAFVTWLQEEEEEEEEEEEGDKEDA